MNKTMIQQDYTVMYSLIAGFKKGDVLITLSEENNHDKISYCIIYEQYTIRYENEKEARNEFLKCIENLLNGEDNA